MPSALSSIEGNYNIVFEYDASDVGHEWKSYTPERPAFLNTLTELKPEFGYWIKMDNSDSLEINGTIMNGAVVDLAQGWNLIGYPSLEEENLTIAFTDIMSNLELVFAWKEGIWESYSTARPGFLNTLTTMKPGYGYWVKVNQNMSLTIP